MKVKVKKTPSKKQKMPSGSSREDKMMVLLEDMRGEIKAVAEGHSDLRRAIDDSRDELRNEIGGLRNGMSNNIDGLRNELNSKIDGLRNEMKENFKIVFEHFSNIEDEIMEIKSEMKEIRRELLGKADRVRLDALEKRVAELEQRQIIIRDAAGKKYKTKK